MTNEKYETRAAMLLEWMNELDASMMTLREAINELETEVDKKWELVVECEDDELFVPEDEADDRYDAYEESRLRLSDAEYECERVEKAYDSLSAVYQMLHMDLLG